MKRNVVSCAILTGLAIILLGQTLPSVPSTISYQGRLTDSAEEALPDGEYELTFLLYNAPTGGILLWSETRPDVAVSGGLYRTALGEAEPIGFAAFGGPEVYLEVRVFGEAVGPRSRVVSVPFALKAEGEVPEGAVVLGESSGDTAITELGYAEQGDTIGPYYLYRKDAYDPGSARVPGRIAYQGKVGPVGGSTVGATANFGFTIFDADTGGNAVWSETQDDVPVDASGLFSVELGVNNPIAPVDLVSKDLWLSVSVNGETLSPREKLASAGYALKVTSPTPEGAIVLSASTTNPDLTSKKFSLVAGTTVDGYYPFRKDAFNLADPAVPLLVNYQGKLTDLAGDTLSASAVDIGFRIFDDATAGTLLWSETVGPVALTSGIFHALLGSTSNLTPQTFSGPDAWLETTVVEGTTVETLSPRQRLTSVPFALSAEGTLPPSALVLSTLADSDTLSSSGFQATGDTVGGYFIYEKTDVDLFAPYMEIIVPGPESSYTVHDVPVVVDYFDNLSGVDTSTFTVILNGVTVTSGFTITPIGATGTVPAQLGQNVLIAVIYDRMGIHQQALTYFYMDDTGTPPVVSIINPPDFYTIYTNTPEIIVDFSDPEAGIDLDSIVIYVNGDDRTSMFTMAGYGSGVRATWRVPPAYALPDGTNLVNAEANNNLGQIGTAGSTFDVASTCVNPTIASLSKPMTLAGGTITITGTGFSTTLTEDTVVFSGGAAVHPTSATATQLSLTVPASAQSGPLKVVVNECASEETDFIVGLNYGFVTNYDNPLVNNGAAGTVSVIDFDTASPGTTLNNIPCGAKPYDVAVSPDGRAAYVTAGNTICVINTATALTSDTVQTISIAGPRNVKVSPDGLEFYVGAPYQGAWNVFRVRNHFLDYNKRAALATATELNDIAVSALHQALYVARNRLSTMRGSLEAFSIDRGEDDFFLPLLFGESVYRVPLGVAVRPCQDKVYVANNRSNAASAGGDQGQSFSYMSAADGSGSATFGAEILPNTDSHDVNWPYDVVFDPRGQLMYASFALGYAGTGQTYYTTNNVGARKWATTNLEFSAATATQMGSSSVRSPRGLAFTPDGKLLFAAAFGLGTSQGDKVMILDHQKVKTAIDLDPGDGSYNLTGSGAMNLENASVYGNPGIVRFHSGFDGPRNVAFQEFPIIEIVPHVIHLAIGGVAPGADRAELRVHPIYGDTVHVGLSDGTSILLGPSLSGLTWHRHWLAPSRQTFTASNPSGDHVTLTPKKEGVGELLAEHNASHYPSQVAFVTVPPQRFIQVLFAEVCPNSNEITYRALAAVVKNRTRLTRTWFKKSAWWGTDGQKFDFSPRVGNNLNGAVQVQANNATEELVTEQLALAFNHGYDCTDPSHTGAYNRFLAAAQRRINPLYLPAEQLWNYDMSVVAAGDAMLDLVNTLTNGDTMFDLTAHDLIPGTTAYDDPDYLDSYPDPTGGSFSFYSPSNEEWSGNTIADNISEALASGTTTFPNAGNFETTTICGSTTGQGMLRNFCIEENGQRRAKYIQVVVVQGIPNNYDQCGGSSKNQAPQFIFLRFRENDAEHPEPAVVWGP